jgi:hypothetical protein
MDGCSKASAVWIVEFVEDEGHKLNFSETNSPMASCFDLDKYAGSCLSILS